MDCIAFISQLHCNIFFQFPLAILIFFPGSMSYIAFNKCFPLLLFFYLCFVTVGMSSGQATSTNAQQPIQWCPAVR